MTIIKSITFLEEENAKKFRDVFKICQKHFGEPRISGSHHIFKTPWQGDPRINIQKGKGNLVKPYQIKQVLNALYKLDQLKKESSPKNE